MIIHQFSLPHLYSFSLKCWENVLFELRSERDKHTIVAAACMLWISCWPTRKRMKICTKCQTSLVLWIKNSYHRFENNTSLLFCPQNADVKQDLNALKKAQEVGTVWYTYFHGGGGISVAKLLRHFPKVWNLLGEFCTEAKKSTQFPKFIPALNQCWSLPGIMVISCLANIVQKGGGMFYLGLGYPKVRKKRSSVSTFLQPIV